MSDEPQTPKKSSKKPLMIGLALALLGGGGGFFAVQSGVIGGAGPVEDHAQIAAVSDSPKLSFVPLDPLIVSLAREGGRDHLRFSAQLEVVPEFANEVEAVKPRIVDVLNGYLRAVEVAQLEDPAALIRLRAQMLRRIQIVTGEGRVRDLLIMEFVLS
ncbi:flagellar basal body-associated FliL family protein [Loktanella sp. S4079]|uniref:flagellar basal body-associated FliL family protein n=1 Tax=Loktanella sp. S4079 TaxID=579483 RepID=UPI0005FA0EB7|nr:flagellar basal body-associated FliL family protein [Loktanella sp. S4079]KJZ21160.1 flagellar basal body protein FliL [Loktanella sp. S4079]